MPCGTSPVTCSKSVVLTVGQGQGVERIVFTRGQEPRPPGGGGVFTRLQVGLKEGCHEIVHLYLFQDSNPSGPLINIIRYFRILSWFRRDIQILRNIPPQSQSPRCTSCTAEPNRTPRSQNQNICLSNVYHCFKGTIRRNPFRREHIYHKKISIKCWFANKIFFNSVVCCTPWRQLCDQISGQKREINRGRKCCDTLPLKIWGLCRNGCESHLCTGNSSITY